jgi:hypothetical protein
MNITPHIQLIVQHWIKERSCDSARSFRLKYRHLISWLPVGFVAIVFCVVSSLDYEINDIVDAETGLSGIPTKRIGLFQQRRSVKSCRP